MALNGLFCADVPLRNYSLTHSLCVFHSGAEAVDGVGSSKFSYMNAADVAVALQTGGSGSASVARVKSVHSDDEAEEKLDPDQSAEDLNRQRSSPPPVPTPDV